jgi:hypothetical protein
MRPRTRRGILMPEDGPNWLHHPRVNVQNRHRHGRLFGSSIDILKGVKPLARIPRIDRHEPLRASPSVDPRFGLMDEPVYGVKRRCPMVRWVYRRIHDKTAREGRAKPLALPRYVPVVRRHHDVPKALGFTEVRTSNGDLKKRLPTYPCLQDPPVKRRDDAPHVMILPH